jgi:membrane-bound lytic murein transglycosylase B
MRLGPIRPAAAALAAGLPVLLVGMLTSHAPTGQQANADTVRTHLVAPPASSLHQPGSLDEALDGAHPPTDPLVEIVDATGGPGSGTDRGVPIRVTGTALPARVLLAYRVAAADLRGSDPSCHLPWYLLAGIGQVESGQAYGGAVDRHGRTLNPILGPVLDGTGDFAAIPDTDNGRWDGDKTWDRAVGPMQFIPSSWAVWGRDGDGNGVADPSDIDDAALATASYLCAGDRDLRNIKDERSAIFSYNHSWDYVDLVVAWATAFEHGTTVVVGGGGTAAPRSGRAGAGGAGGGTVAGTPVALPSDVPVVVEPAPTQPPPSAAPPDGATAPASGSPQTAAPTGPASGPAPTATEAPSPTASPSPTCPTPSDPPSGTATPTGTPSPTETPTPDPSGSPSPTGSPTDPIDPCATPTGQPGG